MAEITFGCGCRVSNERGWSLVFCPLHEAAADLLAACEAVLRTVPYHWHPDYKDEDGRNRALKKAAAAAAAARAGAARLQEFNVEDR